MAEPIPIVSGLTHEVARFPQQWRIQRIGTDDEWVIPAGPADATFVTLERLAHCLPLETIDAVICAALLRYHEDEAVHDDELTSWRRAQGERR